MFRKQRYPYETMKEMFNLTQDYIKEDTSTSLIGAYKILSSLQEGSYYRNTENLASSSLTA
jgi:hypothetical protein